MGKGYIFVENDTTMKILQLTLILFLTGISLHGQIQPNTPEIDQIATTLMKYIDGTANGEPQKLREAFHPDFNLYSATESDSLLIRKGQEYIGNVKEGKKANRVGRIISIDYEKDTAIAKVEIIIPNWRVFIDYFLLVKYAGSWKIIHKSYTWKPIPKNDK